MVFSAKSMIFVIFLAMAIDISGDSILRAFPFEKGLLVTLSQGLIAVLIMLFTLIFGFKLPRKIELIVPFFLIILVLLLGLINGLIFNRAKFAISEIIPFLFVFSFLAFCSLKNPISVKELEHCFTVIIYLILGKAVVYNIFTYFLLGDISWKVLLKQSPALILPLSYFFSKIATNRITTANYLTLSVIIILITFAMARMLFLAMIFIICIHFLNRRIFKNIQIIVLIVLSFFIYQLLVGSSTTGIIDFLYGGNVFELGIDYRLVQLQVIISRLEASPLLGVGFGYFTPGYLDYGLLSKPYLLELDILNFISKIGIIGSIVYAISYIMIYRLIGLILCPVVRKTSLSLFWGIAGLLVYSTGQTAHQSYLFWVLLAFVYGFVVSHLRTQSPFPKVSGEEF